MSDQPEYIEVARPWGEPIRKFADANISDAIDRALAQVPEGKSIAVVAYADLDGVKGAVMYRLGGDWSFVATVGKQYDGPLEASAVVRWAR